MKIPEDYKDQISGLLESGDKLGAVRFAQKNLGLDADQALTLAEQLQAQAISIKPPPPAINPVRLVGIIFTVVGFGLLSAAFVIGFQDYRFAQTAMPVTGKVLRIDSRLSDNTTMYMPVIGFSFAGREREYVSNVSSSSPVYSVGDNVELLINPRDPSEVVINSFLDRWFVVSLLGSMGLIFSVIGYVVRRAMTTR